MTGLRSIDGVVFALLGLAVGLAPSATGQDSEGRFVGSHGTSYFYRAWTHDSGLPQDMVADIVQTADGYVWFTTFGGLGRFDGFEMRVFDLASDGELLSNSMSALYADSRGALWIGHNAQGLNRYRAARFTALSVQHGLPRGKVWAMAEDRDGILWVGTISGLVALRGGELWRGPGGLPAGPVLCLLVDRGGGLWVGTGHGLFHRRAGATTFSKVAGVPSVDVQAMIEDGDGTLWLATRSGLMRRLRGWSEVLEAPCAQTELTSPTLARLALDRSGDLWFSTCSDRERQVAARLYRIAADRRSSPAPLGAELFELPGLPVTALRADREGGLWLGTQGHGLYRLQEQPVRRWTVDDGLRARELRVVLGDGEGGLWLAVGCGAPLTHFSDGRFTPYVSDVAGRELPCVGSLARGRDGDLWIGSRGELLRLHRGRVIESHALFDGAQGAVINTVFEDRDGAFWVGTNGQGLARVRDGSITYFTRDDGLSTDYVHFLAQDRDGALWIGASDGLNRLVGGRLSSYGRADGLPPGMVRAIHQDRDGSLWIGTYGGGLARYREGVFTRLTMEDGLHDNVVTRILEDERGRLWMLGNLGLSYVHRDQLHAVADGELPRLTPVSFGVAEGMIEGSGARQPAGWRMADGTMWFPTVDGLAMIDAAAFRPDDVAPAVHIDKVLVEGRQVPRLDAVELAAGERDVEIHYTAPSFAAPDEVRFRFRLEGYDDDWHSAGPRRVAYFTNLSPGVYTFRVSAANRHGVWNEQGTSLLMRVAPPMWQTWWAYTLYVVALFVSLVALFKWQQRRIERERAVSRRLREVDRLKDDFLANTSHELRTPLYGMVGLAEALLDDAGGDLSDTARSHLSAVVTSGRRLSLLVDDILDFSKLRHDHMVLEAAPVDLRAAADVVLTLCRPLIGGRDLVLVNRLAADLPPVWADEDRVQQILHNLVGNAVKFTEAGSIELTARLDGDAVEVSIADTGVGIAFDEQERIFGAFEQADQPVARTAGGTGLGLAVTRQLVELHGGRIRVDSTPGVGSTFLFTLPVQREGAGEAAGPRRAPARPVPAVSEPAPVLDLVAKSPVVTHPDAKSPAEASPAESTAVKRPAAASAVENGKPRVLVVDDEPVNRQVLVSQLRVGGYDVEAVAGGEEAMSRIRRGGVDLVLLDIMMPRMSGYEACRALRRLYSAQELPVIFLTAKSQIGDRVAGLVEGANDYLLKPIAKDELLARVDTHLGLLAAQRRLSGLLERRTEQVQVLGGLLPICAECKKVRDDEGYWDQIEVFLSSRSELQFSHGLCPPCAERFMAEVDAGLDADAGLGAGLDAGRVIDR